jgi:hypothetical protein
MADPKSTMLERVHEGREWLISQWQGFRSESQIFQLKAGIAAAYAVICIATILLVPPAGIAWTVDAKSIPWGISTKTYVEIQNIDGGDLEDVTVEVRGKFYDEFKKASVPGTWKTKKLKSFVEGNKLKLFPEDLRGAKNETPANTLVVEEVTIFEGEDVVLRTAPRQGR